MSHFQEGGKEKMDVTKVMNRGMELADLFVNKNYLIDIDKCEPIPLSEEEQTFSALSFFQVDKIVFNQKESINDKLVSVYSALSNFGSSVLLMIVGDERGVGFFLGTRDSKRPDVAKSILKKSLQGNFPGIHILEKGAFEIEELLKGNIPEVYAHRAITSVSIVPSIRNEKDKNGFVQGIEKFIDTMAGEKYTAIFVSSPLSKEDLEDKKRGYEELYSSLSQCSQLVLTYGENESDAVQEGISKGFSKSINDGISDTTGKNAGTNRGKGRSRSHGFNFGLLGTGINTGGGANFSKGTYEGTSESHSENYSETESTSSTETNSKTRTVGTSASIQLTRHNKTVEELLEKIDEQLDRIKDCEAYGLWDSACYFIAEREEVAIVAANTYKALVAGEKTGVENSFTNIWDSEYEHHEKSLKIMDYLRYGLHPKFLYESGFSEDGYESQHVTVASLVSGLELPILMGLPQKSVSGLTAIESVEFGRNVFRKDGRLPRRKVDLGAVYHMGEVFPNNRVELNLDNLSSHCFITGSTGSGKSNTCAKLIDELVKPENKIGFLVIEPAKGEYKQDFGGMKNIHIFTTNPKYYSMLCLSPFAFDEEIHVLEHLDRLIEIFNACWPLYAAMPAVLKAAFERAYILHGWDLNYSRHRDLGNGKFPCFKDIVELLPAILEESDFSKEIKGNYIGSLVTRVESLTNGLLGQIFNSASVSDELLFNENTIVDLSRIGSMETKALIMGILVLKLSEFRQARTKGNNLPLRHVTILEEAHNLLKRTSTEQGQESANLQGKSVEMISNSIAEMRTYGEGFVIIDQSPSAVDISAIKNTNTKIVMRVPEEADCEAIGRSIGLKEEQITELSKLDKGVAVVFQNGWLEPVLTKIDKASGDFKEYSFRENDLEAEKDLRYRILEELIHESEEKKYNLSWLRECVYELKLNKSVHTKLEKMVTAFYEEWKKGSERNLLSELIFQILNCGDLLRMFESELPEGITEMARLSKDIIAKSRIWAEKVYKGLDQYAKFLDSSVKDQVFKNIILYQIELGKHAEQYKVALYCIQNRKELEKKEGKEKESLL